MNRQGVTQLPGLLSERADQFLVERLRIVCAGFHVSIVLCIFQLLDDHNHLHHLSFTPVETFLPLGHRPRTGELPTPDLVLPWWQRKGIAMLIEYVELWIRHL